jgi:hypothetical protein
MGKQSDRKRHKEKNRKQISQGEKIMGSKPKRQAEKRQKTYS